MVELRDESFTILSRDPRRRQIFVTCSEGNRVTKTHLRAGGGVQTVAVLAAEAALLRPGMTSRQLRMSAGLDGLYGAIAGSLILEGFARVFFGAKTLRILYWRRSIRANAAFTLPMPRLAPSADS